MLTISNDLLAAFRATTRQVKAKIDIVWTESILDPSVVVAANDENRAAHLTQVLDGEIEVTRNWAHLDGVIKANGQWNPMPYVEAAGSDKQVGWYGSQSCDGSGEWITNPELTLTFDPKPILSLSLTGESNYNEYPVDFEIKIYAGATLEHTETVTGNTLMTWVKDLTVLQLASITKMVLTVKKWSTPNRVVKITEFFTTYTQTIFSDDIVSLSLLEERVIADGTLPIGNISANEIDVALQNIKIGVSGVDVIDPFYPANPNSIFADLLAKNIRVIPYIGAKLSDNSIEYLKLGTFWSDDWTVQERTFSAKFTARDRMELLRRAEFKGSTLYTTTTLYDMIVDVLEFAKTDIPMIDLNYQIDTELQNYTIEYGWLPKNNYFKTIKTIVEACMGQAYMSREDVLIVEGPSALTT